MLNCPLLGQITRHPHLSRIQRRRRRRKVEKSEKSEKSEKRRRRKEEMSMSLPGEEGGKTSERYHQRQKKRWQ
jgi:hypothetical protein